MKKALYSPSLLQQQAVLNKALLRLADFLRIERKELSAIIGKSESSICRLYDGKNAIKLHSTEGQLGLLLLRVFRSLDALLGGNQEQCRTWLRSQNTHLQAIPADKIQTISGLVEVANYLDAMRGKA